jgi:hypothetical protein
MAKYQRVSPRFWQDPKVRRWPDHQKLLGSYLLTCPHRTSEGLFWLPHGYVAQDLGWSIERVSEGYSGLIEAGFCAYDDTSETVLLCNALKYEAPAGPKQIQGAITRLSEVPPTPLFAQLRDAAATHAPGFAAALDKAPELQHHRGPTDTPPKGYRNRTDSSSSSSSSNSVSNSKTEPSPTGRTSATATPAVITPIPTAQTYVAAYIDAYRGRAGHDPPRQVKGQVAKHLRTAFEDGIPPDTIKAGFVEWFDRDQHPATLPSFIEVAGRGGRSQRRTRQQQGRDQLIETDQALGRWAEQRQQARERGDNNGRTTVASPGQEAQWQLPRPGAPT